MPHRVSPRPLVVAGLCLVLLVAVGFAARGVWQRTHHTGLEQAIRDVPAATKRLGFTDWAAIRAAVGVHGTSPARVRSLVERAYDRDLSATSSMSDSAPALQAHYGFSPANATWEAYAQAQAGSAMVLRMPDAASFDDLARRLTRLGYTRPSAADGVWRGGQDLVAGIDDTLTPEVQYVVLLAGRHLVVSSDTASYAAATAKAARGDAATLDSVAGVTDMAGRVGDPAAAMVWSRDFACSDLAMSQASDDDQATAEQLVTEAGKVTPLTGLTMALAPGRRFTVAEQFADSGQAEQNLRARARLVVGEDPVRSGSYADLWRLRSARTRGATVLLGLQPKDRTGFVLSDVYSGPVLFATC